MKCPESMWLMILSCDRTRIITRNWVWLWKYRHQISCDYEKIIILAIRVIIFIITRNLVSIFDIVFRNAPKSKILFRLFFWFKIDLVFIFWSAPLMFEIFEMPHFSYLILAIEKIMQIVWQSHLSHAFWGLYYYSVL